MNNHNGLHEYAVITLVYNHLQRNRISLKSRHHPAKAMATWLKRLSVGAYLEVSDKYNTWCIGIVEDIEDSGQKMKIRYIGWHSKWIEWINISSDNTRLAPLSTNIVPLIFNKHPEQLQLNE